MSNTTTVTLERRKVIKVRGGYQVVKYYTNIALVYEDSKIYTHSTSAFAALGRLVQKDTLAA